MAPTEMNKHNTVRQNYALEKSASTKDMLMTRFILSHGNQEFAKGTFLRTSPEYLVRTGSMKNKVIQASSASSVSSTLPLPQERSKSGEGGKKGRGNYAVYNIQAGCYTWQGRWETLKFHQRLELVIVSLELITKTHI